MPRVDPTDVQGFVLRGYTYPVARFLFLRLNGGDAALQWLGRLVPFVTTGGKWESKPETTVNVAFTFQGLRQLRLPSETLQSFPVEFAEGMRSRSAILSDTGRNAPGNWEKLWLDGSVHVWLAVYGQTPEALEARCSALKSIAAETAGAEVVGQQDAAALVIGGKPTPNEHFGYRDGFGNPDYADVERDHQPGQGKLNKDGSWTPLATGELLLGYADEAGELPVAPEPHLLGDNGTFMVYRKLHQNVKSFRDYVSKFAPQYPGGEAKFRAKFVGRWPDGTPLELSPDAENPDIAKDKHQNVNFTYGKDADGVRCPFNAHIRRAHPRDGFGFNGALVNRRRISRRGLPYGAYAPPDQPVKDSDERGIAFMALNASLFRQFEFVQQQWLEYGNDALQGNDKDALLGNHEGQGRFMIQGADDDNNPPFLCAGLPSFVELRGGDYFFLPSITALRLMATGKVDPR